MGKKIKKDFDKDMMYQKIMPSASAVEPPPREEKEKAPAKAPTPPTPPVAKGPELHNFMEDMVKEKLEHTMKVLEACDCERCRLDIMALALNALPTAYAVTEGDYSRHLKKLKGSYEVKVTAAIIKAIQEVKKNPKHSGQNKS